MSGWFKSPYSTANGNCVEVNISLDHVAVRDSKDRSGAFLTFTLEEWAAFLDGAKAGLFDLTSENNLVDTNG